MQRDNEPLDQEERSVVTRALLTAYLRYRAMPLRRVCKHLKVWLCKQHQDNLTGYTGSIRNPPRQASRARRKREWRVKNFSYWIQIPGKNSSTVSKEHTFWHEVGHVVLKSTGIFSRYAGYHAYLYRFSERYWSEERSVEAFATAMMLYRYGIDPKLEASAEQFIFADEKSDWYQQMMRFESSRILDLYHRAKNERSNTADIAALTALGTLLAHCGSCTIGLQRDLPMQYADVHRECYGPQYHYVDWWEDVRRNYEHADKATWRKVHPDEQRLLAQAKRLREAYARVHQQAALFPDQAESELSALEKQRKRFERAVEKFQRTTPA